MKVLFHCHTTASRCSNLKKSDLVKYLDENGFDAVFVTDHEVITVLDWPSGLVVPSCEISTSEGDIIGIFLEQSVPSGLTIAETIALIKKQGGLVVAPHPCDRLRGEAMGARALKENIKHFDIIETYNSRNIFYKDNKVAKKSAQNFNLLEIVGSDAHTIEELGNAYVEIANFSNAKEFLKALKNAKFHSRPAGLSPHIKTFIIKRFLKR